MKTIAMTIALLAGLPLALSAQVTKEDIKKLTAAGISDEVILSYVKANGGVARLSAEDLVELKQAGASEKLMTTVLSVTPAEPRTNVAPQQRQAYTAPATTPYVTDSTPYYYTPSSTYYSDYYSPSYAASYSYGSYGPYYPSYYYSSYYPRSYYYSSCYPRSYYYSSCYPRYYSPGLSIGVSVGGHSSRGYIGVGGYRHH